MRCGGSKLDDSKIKIIFVIGGPGCKKGTFCKIIRTRIWIYWHANKRYFKKYSNK